MPRVRSNSRLRFADFVVIDGIEFWNMIEYPEIEAQPDDIYHVVVGWERIDLLAEQYYGDSRLKFIIALANDIEIEPTEFNVSETILIPSPRWIREVSTSEQSRFIVSPDPTSHASPPAAEKLPQRMLCERSDSDQRE